MYIHNLFNRNDWRCGINEKVNGALTKTFQHKMQNDLKFEMLWKGDGGMEPFLMNN